MTTQDNTSPVIAATTAALSETESTVNQPGVDNSTETCLGAGGTNHTTVDIVGGSPADTTLKSYAQPEAPDMDASATGVEGSTESTTEASDESIAATIVKQRGDFTAFVFLTLLVFVLVIALPFLIMIGFKGLIGAALSSVLALSVSLMSATLFHVYRGKIVLTAKQISADFAEYSVQRDQEDAISDAAKVQAQAVAAAAVYKDFAAQAPGEQAAFAAAFPA